MPYQADACLSKGSGNAVYAMLFGQITDYRNQSLKSLVLML